MALAVFINWNQTFFICIVGTQWVTPDSNAFTLSPTHCRHLLFISGNCSFTAVMALQQRMGCELDFGSHLELCWRADSILQFPNSALVYMALKQATYALLESTASKNIPRLCGPGKWQIGKWVTEYCVAITHCLRVWRGEERRGVWWKYWFNEMCAIFVLAINLEWLHTVSHIMLLSVLLEMGNWKRVH